MDCCTPYTIPKVCLNAGSTKVQQFIYQTPDGMPISLIGATIKWKLIYQLDNSIVIDTTIKNISKNTCTMNLSTSGLSGNYEQRIEIALISGDILVDKGVVLIYG